jgi:hypothetical protein
VYNQRVTINRKISKTGVKDASCTIWSSGVNMQQTMASDFDWSNAPNLVRVIVPFAKALLKAFNVERDYEVIKRRFGLDGSKNYTLQDIGDYYGISRERVRQMEERATRRIRDTFTGSLNLPELPVPGNVKQETNSLKNELKKQREGFDRS